ncbi:hypothetical protein [Fibrobacter sp.]|uniref:hypothetical protein n=1 Tax=Fibrobacter sp. TaxID=35828 RepID=UPI001568723D
MTIHEALDYLVNEKYEVTTCMIDTGFGFVESWTCRKEKKEVVLYDCGDDKQLINFSTFSNNERLNLLSMSDFVKKLNE